MSALVPCSSASPSSAPRSTSSSAVARRRRSWCRSRPWRPCSCWARCCWSPSTRAVRSPWAIAAWPSAGHRAVRRCSRALLVVVTSIVLLAVLLFSIGQGAADNDADTPVSIFYRPTSSWARASSTPSSRATCSTSTWGSRSSGRLLRADHAGGTESRIRTGVVYIVVSLGRRSSSSRRSRWSTEPSAPSTWCRSASAWPCSRRTPRRSCI